MPNVGLGVRELRIRDPDGIYRVYMSPNSKKQFMCFIVFRKNLKQPISKILSWRKGVVD